MSKRKIYILITVGICLILVALSPFWLQKIYVSTLNSAEKFEHTGKFEGVIIDVLENNKTIVIKDNHPVAGLRRDAIITVDKKPPIPLHPLFEKIKSRYFRNIFYSRKTRIFDENGRSVDLSYLRRGFLINVVGEYKDQRDVVWVYASSVRVKNSSRYSLFNAPFLGVSFLYPACWDGWVGSAPAESLPKNFAYEYTGKWESGLKEERVLLGEYSIKDMMYYGSPCEESGDLRGSFKVSLWHGKSTDTAEGIAKMLTSQKSYNDWGNLYDYGGFLPRHRYEFVSSEAEIFPVTIHGEAAAALFVPLDFSKWGGVVPSSQEEAILIVRFPRPLVIGSQEYRFLVIEADVMHITGIAESLDFRLQDML